MLTVSEPTEENIARLRFTTSGTNWLSKVIRAATHSDISHVEAIADNIIVLRGGMPDEYFRLEAGRYIQCKSVIFV